MAIMQIINLYNMVGNFKFFLIILLLFSCTNKQNLKEEIAISIINQNFNVLMESVSFFDLSKVSKNFNDTLIVNIDSKVIAMNADESIKLFKTRFNIKEEKMNPFFFEIKKIPQKKINDFSVTLVSQISKNNDRVNVNFTNFLIDESHKFCSVTVLKSRGIGFISEIYYFKIINGKWIFDGKELITIG